MRKIYVWLSMLFALVLLGHPPIPVNAATSPKVLLVYDSLNAQASKRSRVSQLQQLLLAAGVSVHTQTMATYQAGELSKNHYAGVVTMINWDDAQMENQAFFKDRAAFSGITLHIGGNLQAAELSALGAKAQPLYRRQMLASWPKLVSPQLLPYTTPLWVLAHTPATAINIGHLAIQGSDRQFPYATIVGRHAFLPYFDGQGQSELAGAALIAKLFGKTTSQAPLLTITGVSPYANLSKLQAMGHYLGERNIPFAVSASSVARNTELSAFRTYTKTLRKLVANGGVIFLKTPVVQDPVLDTGFVNTKTLANDMTSTLTALAQQHVFPIGVSFPTYWQNDHLFRTQALQGATTALQLPDPASLNYAKEDDQAQPHQTTFATVAASSLLSNRYGQSLATQPITANLPLAIRFAVPDSQTDLQRFKQQVSAFAGEWLAPETLSTTYQIGMLSLAYQHGQYFVNGRRATGTYHTPKQLKLERTPQLWVNKFFAKQGKLMWGFFAVTATVMVIMLILGRRVYLKMYKRR